MPTVPPPLNFGADAAAAAPQIAAPPALPTVNIANASGQSFLDAPEVSAEFVADDEQVRPVWPAAPTPATESARPSAPPPLPRVSAPPAPPAELRAPEPAASSPFDALDELSASDAEEVDASEVEVSLSEDDAPSLDDLMALTVAPSGGDIPLPPGPPRRKS